MKILVTGHKSPSLRPPRNLATLADLVTSFLGARMAVIAGARAILRNPSFPSALAHSSPRHNKPFAAMDADELVRLEPVLT
jgi:hypothetical protein